MNQNELQVLIDKIDSIGTMIHRTFDVVAANLHAEKVEKITGVVLGRRVDGQPCAWLFGEEHLQYKIATVWQEQFQYLPEELNSLGNGKTWPTASPPTRAEAVASDWWRPCEFQVVLKATGKQTESGRAVYEFDRVLGHEEQTVVTTTASAPQSVDELRARAVRAKSAREFAEAAAPLFGQAFDSTDRLERFVGYIVGSMPTVYPAALVAAETYAAMLATGAAASVPAGAAKGVYDAAAGAMG